MSKSSPLALFVVFGLLGLGCPQQRPTPTGTACPDPDPGTLSWDNFGHDFMYRYCTWCHDSHLTHSHRNGAPIYHDFDTLRGVLEVPDHIDEEAGSGPSAHNTLMPGLRCPSVAGGPLDKDCDQPTDAERVQLAQWIACERNRPFLDIDSGIDGAPAVDAGLDAAPDAP